MTPSTMHGVSGRYQSLMLLVVDVFQLASGAKRKATMVVIQKFCRWHYVITRGL